MINDVMNLENWQRWVPITGLAEKYDVIHISNNMVKDFKIVLVDEINKENQIQLIFEKSIDAYRLTYDSFRENTYSQLYEKYGFDFYHKWSFFRVYNSEYIKTLYDETEIDINTLQLIHFCILSSELVIDIIASYDPKVEPLIND